MDKKKYKDPQMEVIKLYSESLLTTLSIQGSGGGGTGSISGPVGSKAWSPSTTDFPWDDSDNEDVE